MALRFPFRQLASEVEHASKDTTGGKWRRLGTLLDRNFAEAERWTQTTDAFPNKRVATVLPAADRTTTSTSYVSWPVTDTLTATFTKRLDKTRLIVTLETSHFVTGAANDVDFGIAMDGGSTTDLLRTYMNALSDHRTVVGSIEIVGVAAGEHTFVLKAKVGTASTTLHADTNDQVSFVIEEVA